MALITLVCVRFITKNAIVYGVACKGILNVSVAGRWQRRTFCYGARATFVCRSFALSGKKIPHRDSGEEQTDEEKLAQSERESLFAINDYAAKYFINNLNNTPEGEAVGMSYFRERGFTDETVKKFQLGYSLDEFNAFSKEATASGYNPDLLEKLGLSIRREADNSLFDRFRGRVMFPVHSLSGKVVAFGGRILKKDEKAAKYLNSPESSIYHKSNELYGLYFAKQSIVRQDRCILVEGYTDVISMHQSGIENVVASSGTSLTSPQIRLIRRFTPNVTVIYDGDAAGIQASIRGIDLLLEEGMNVKVLLLPGGQDPDSYAQAHNASILSILFPTIKSILFISKPIFCSKRQAKTR